MKILKILGFVVLAIAGLTVFGKVRQKMGSGATASGQASTKDPGLSPSGFFLLNKDEAKNPRVSIMTPPNCPSHEAQRARALQASLQAAGIPCELRASIDVVFTDMKEAKRVEKHMDNAPMPIVLVRGWAKGNPSLTEVIAQYNLR